MTLSGVVRGIYIDHPAKVQLSEVEKKPYLDQKTKYVFNKVIKSEFIRWLKYGVRIPKQF